jgi:hypothetical protein
VIPEKDASSKGIKDLFTDQKQMQVDQLLNSPYTQEVADSIYLLSSNEKQSLFYGLLNNLKNTYRTGTSIYTLHSIVYLTHILQSKFRKDSNDEENTFLLSVYVEKCLEYISFAQSESIQFATDLTDESSRYHLVGVENLEKLLAHGDILPLALEYGYEEIRKKGGQIPEYLERQLTEINMRYF